MKTIVRIAALSGTLLIGGLARAQETPAAPVNTPAPVATPAQDPAKTVAAPMTATRPRPADGWRGLPLGQLVKQVGITPEQTAKGKEINAKYVKEYQALDANMPMEDRKAKVKSIMDARETEVKAMLTPEQLEKYKNMRTPSGEVVGREKGRLDGKTTAPPAMKEATPVKEAAPVDEKKSDK